MQKSSVQPPLPLPESEPVEEPTAGEAHLPSVERQSSALRAQFRSSAAQAQARHKPPLLSVVIPNWNGLAHLPTCLGSLSTQTYPHLEIILVDNGSSDRSVAYTRQHFPEVLVLALQHNLGLTGAINRGIALAGGEFIAALNNDTEVEPEWAEALVDAFEQYPDAGIIASKMLLFDRRDILHAAGDGFRCDGLPYNRGVWQEDSGQFDDDVYIFGACGGAAAYRRSMLQDIGMFDEDLFMYCEDVDLNWRAQLAGYRCVFAPKARVYHRLSATGGGVIASYYTGRNTILTLIKNYPKALWRRHRAAIIRAQLRISRDALRAWRGEAARARLRGQLAALRRLPVWLEKRRRVQSRRKVSIEYLASLLTPCEH